MLPLAQTLSRRPWSIFPSHVSLVVAVNFVIETRLTQGYFLVLMSTMRTILSIPCLSIDNWTSAHFGFTRFCLLRLSLSEPCYLRKAPRLFAPERVMSMSHSEGSGVRIVAFPVVLGVSSEDLAQTDGDFCVLYEEFVDADVWSLSSMTGKNATLCCD